MDLFKQFTKLFTWFQAVVRQWNINCLGVDEFQNEEERRYRVLEECMEYFQAKGLPIEKVLEMALIVYSKEPGEVHQEAAGIMISLMVSCSRDGIDLGQVTVDEYHRVEDQKERIQRKQLTKPISYRSSGVVDWQFVNVKQELLWKLESVLKHVQKHGYKPERNQSA